MGSKFVKPETVQRDLPCGEFILVKKQLNTGEKKKVEAAGLNRPVVVDGRIYNPIDWNVYDVERILPWLADWSFRDDENKPVKVSFAALQALDPDVFEEITKEVDAYAAEVRAAKKSSRTPEPTTDTPTSSEPSAEPK